MEQFDLLNEIYEPLCRRCRSLRAAFSEWGISSSVEWYNNHYIERDGKYVPEYYPIPVIALNGIGDLLLDLEHIALECAIEREKAEKLDYSSLVRENPSVEIYGAADYLQDFYKTGMDADSTAARIQKSEEKEVHFVLYFDVDAGAEKILRQYRTLF